MSFLKTPYLGGSLEKNPEQIVINFDGMDCVTFVENVFNIARQIKSQRYDITDLVDKITQTRYRDGVLEDYASRLHYTSE